MFKNYHKNRELSVAGWLLRTGVTVVLAAPVWAQDTIESPRAEAERRQPVKIEEVVVTGTRLAATGFKTPMPLTVVDNERMEQLAITNIADALNQLPSLRPTSTPTTGGLLFHNIGANFVDLRGLGASRSLVLVDGRRFVASNTSGIVDLNLIPSMLVARTEVVTGGASAAYGSDAVSGVVNIILDTDFNGVKGQMQGGTSEEGDYESLQGSLAGGFDFADGRGHAVVGGEYYRNEGIGDVYNRDWGQEEWQVVTNTLNAVNGQPRNVISPFAHSANMAPGGMIVFPPLRGTAFDADGQTRPFEFGDFGTIGNLFMVGGEGFGTTSFLKNIPLSVPTERFSTLAHVDYNFSDSLSGFFEVSFGQAEGEVNSAQPRNFVPVPNTPFSALTIFRDNPYLPANLAGQMAAMGLNAVTVGRISNDIGPALGMSRNRTWRFATGLDGEIGGIGWDASYQYGRNNHYQRLDNALNVANFRLATDAVLDGDGNVVCRSTLANPGNGCVPFNAIGEHQFSAAAKDYVTGSSFQDLDIDQHTVAVNFHAEPFSTWAGPVAVAAGGEYRRESASSDIDDVSAAAGFQVGNTVSVDGDIDVAEAYLEVGIPLMRDGALGDSLDFNGAVRRTDYSTSGGVTTWKVGSTWQPSGSLLFRATRSPNLGELFTSAAFSANAVTDPQTGTQSLVQIVGGGNPDLLPEIADTYTIGVVLTPESLIPGLSLSVDYYNIELDGAVGTLGPQNIVNFCAQGLTTFCPLINDGAGLNGPITQVFNGSLNINQLLTEGFDIETAYTLPLSDLSPSWGGDLNLRLMATHVRRMEMVDAVAGGLDRAGQTGVPVGDLGGTSNQFTGGGGVPDWTLDGVINYTFDPISVTLHGRYIAEGKFGEMFVGPDDSAFDPAAANSINDNTVSGRFYLNLSASYNLARDAGRNIKLFGAVTNLLDTDPPVAPGSHITNPVLFDVVGRAYKVGVRVNF